MESLFGAERSGFRKTLVSIVVVGRHGLIGRRLLARAGGDAWSTTHRIDEPGPYLDLAQSEGFDYSRLAEGDLVVIAAAISSPDRCARDPALAFRTNVAGTVEFARRARRRGARVVAFSSDVVYGNRAEAVDESASVRPHGPYAEMKWQMEQGLAAIDEIRVLRLSFVVHRTDSFGSYLASCVAADRVAEVFDPFDRCPVDVDDVVEAVLALPDAWARTGGRVVNVGGPQLLARAEMARITRDVALPSLRVRVMPTPAEFLAVRPARINMRSPLLPGILGRPPKTYTEVLTREWCAGTAGNL